MGSDASECTSGILVDNIKRLMGKPFSETTKLQQQMSYAVQEAADGMVEVVCSSCDATARPEHISAEILKVCCILPLDDLFGSKASL